MKKGTRRKQRLDVLLSADETPVFVVDARRKIAFFNSGCQKLTGWSADEVIGVVCDYRTDFDSSTVDSLGGVLCPPPNAFSGQPASLSAQWVDRNGQPLERRIHFFPMNDIDGNPTSILGIITAPTPDTGIAVPTTPAQQLHAELAALHISLKKKFGITTLVCRSHAMLRVAEQIALAGRSRSPIYLYGAPGTGKEHIGRIIHYESDLSAHSFVPLDCRALPAFELKQSLRRLFEAASDDFDAEYSQFVGLQPGTLFLSNVESLPLDTQKQLVEVFGINNSNPMPNLRLMAAGTSDLRAAVETEDIRRDFYFLLTSLVIELPPLVRRTDDLNLLAQAILEDLNGNGPRQLGGFTEEVHRQFREYNWPGNIDELSQVIAEARESATDDLIQVQDLPFRFRAGRDAQAVGPAVRPTITPLEPLLKQIEAEHIQRALDQCRNNKTKAAELLGINRPRLYRRMQALGIRDIDENET